MAVFINFTSQFFYCDTRRCHVYYKDEGGRKSTINVKIQTSDPICGVVLKNTNNNNYDSYLHTVHKKNDGNFCTWSGKINIVSQRNNNKPFKIVFLTKTKKYCTPSLWVLSKRRSKKIKETKTIKRTFEEKCNSNIKRKKRKKDGKSLASYFDAINKKLNMVLQNQMQIMKTINSLHDNEKENIIQKKFYNIQQEYFDYVKTLDDDVTKNVLGC